ncbi:DUF6162 family protein [Vandammella animalimorsus]|uniref:DUF6162 family protein n=1 Tax=Vandammella animalimorsus TaxID=2029117 RepID=UPI00325AE0A4
MTSAEAGAVLPGGCVQQVPPANARQEARWVLATAALVVACSALVVLWHHRHGPGHTALQAHRVDLALDLSAAEQGAYTDLQAVLDEWLAAGAALPPPEPGHWASEGWAPFANDLTAQQRGPRQWALLHSQGRYAYLGVPVAAHNASAASHAAARAWLWRLPSAGAEADANVVDVWLHALPAHPTPAVLTPAGLDDVSLIEQGWQQVAAHLHAHLHGQPQPAPPPSARNH